MAGNSFGGAIKLTGESEYRKALRDITADLRLMSSEMRVMASATDASGKASDADKSKKQALAKAIDEQRSKLSELNKQLAESTEKNGTTSDATKKLQTQVNNATANLNKMEGQLKGTGNEMSETSKKTSVFGDVLKANLASEIIIGGVKALANGIVALGKAFGGAVADGVKYNATIENYTTQFTTMTGSAEKANELIGKIKKTALETPFTIEGMADTINQMVAYGINADDAYTITKQLGDVSGGNADKMNLLGYAMGQVASFGKLQGQELRQLINSGFNPLQEISRTTGESMDSLKSRMEAGKITYEEVQGALASITSEGGRFYNAMNNAAKTFTGQVTQLQEGASMIKGTIAKNLSDALAKGILPALNETTTALGAFLTAVTSGASSEDISKLRENFVTSVKSMADAVAESLPAIVETFGSVIQTIAEALTEAMPTLVPVATQLITTIVETIVTLLPTLLQLASTLILSLVNGIVSALPQLVPAVVNIILTLVNALLSNIGIILQAGIDVLLGLVNGITQALPQLIPAIIQAVMTIIKVLVENLPIIIQAGIQLLVALIEGIANAIPVLVNMLPTIIQTIVRTLTAPAMIVLLIQASLQIIIALAKGLVTAIPEIVKAIPQIIKAIVSGFAGAVADMSKVGLDLVKGIWSGISNATSWILDKIKGFGNSVLNGIKSFFGIKSPSRLFKDEVGKNLALGVGEGFSDSMKDVTKDMQKALPTSFDTDVALNNSGLVSSVADATSLATQLQPQNLVKAIQDAFGTVKIELDDKQLGKFVTNTVGEAVYG